ncbi:MAG: SDR family oxidoreductase [Verrucomicrobia bacterium]|nr:SDR family oxidoreductase [Verrucomicrobiota bacterium]
MKLKNKISLVTGASQGLGKAIAYAFVKEGAHVAICARDGKLIEAVADELRAQAGNDQKIFRAVCDVSSPEQVERLFADISAQLGPVEILVNNAGVYGPKGPSESVRFAEWARAIEINLYGTFLPCQFAIRDMKSVGRGKIINLSGGGATAPLPRISAYAASKAAVVRLTETLAEELREFLIDVNAIAPGPLNTRLLGEVLSAGSDAVGKLFYEKSLKQLDSGGVPLEKAARLCVYLAAEVSAGITGKLISAPWDPWEDLHQYSHQLGKSDVYTIRRIVPEDRGLKW